MNRPSRLLCALLLLTWMACETVVEIDPPAYEPELVVTSYFAPDSLWSAAIHRSLSVGVSQDPSAQYVETATVTILSGSDIVDTLRYAGRGRYVSNTERYPVAGKPYTLRAQAPGMTTAQAVSTAPEPTPISEISFENLGLISPDVPIAREYKFRLRFRLEDPPGRNFYRFGVYKFGESYFADQYPDLNLPDSVYWPIPVDAGDVSWFCGYSEAYRGTPTTGCPGCTCDDSALTDQLFDGQSYQVSVTFSLYPSSQGNARNEILLLVSTLSEDFFEIKRALEEHFNQNAAFSAPQDIYSNVNGGLGVFAGYSNTAVILPIPLDE